MIQEYHQYTPEDFEVWKLLFERQEKNLQDKACKSYLNSLNELSEVLKADEVPNFNKLNEVLSAKNGWSIEVVPGLIPVEDFFELLEQKKFCSSTWLRSKAQLDYLEEPDMFHDIFGHIPLLMDESYSNFAQKLGEVGVKNINNKEVVLQLQRLYWFTIEFGLKKGIDKTEIYGAGIMSSFGESNYIYEANTEIIPFNFSSVINRPFKTDEIQSLYYEIESYDELYNTLNEFDLIQAKL